MSREVVFRRIARLEFEDAEAWYNLKRPGWGSQFKEEVDQTLDRVSDAPEQFRKVRGEIRRAVLRRFPFTIHFLAEDDRIIVLAVYHGKRDPRRLQYRDRQ
jgi:plasmid stabilization system protein ParE